MAEYQDVQHKVAEEIQQVIGDRQPSLEDRGKLPYTEATILEIFRCGSVVPLGVVHATTDDTTVCKYFVIKNNAKKKKVMLPSLISVVKK